jgi:hypothetical protein
VRDQLARISRTMEDGSDVSMPLLDGFLNPMAFTAVFDLVPHSREVSRS